MTNPIKAIALSFLLLAPSPALAGGDWNDAKIKWWPYNDGLAAAKKEKKPICLIVYTDWCPHCTNYSKVFHDPKVVEESKNFVMIRLNGDQEKEVSKQYALDGAYIPRTYFLSPSGKVDESVHAPRDKFKYFYDESNPAGILAGMTQAKAALK
jgi:thioredoxin-like negative regulator of GroEL